MIVVIKRRGVETSQIKIERLVSTLGFGEDCDVSLSTDREDHKLGMLIQQGEGLSFRPLKQELPFFLGDVPVDQMMPLAEGEWLSVDEFELAWMESNSTRAEDELASELPPPPKPLAAPVLPNRAGAMMAYGQTPPASPSQESEESLELSISSKPKEKEVKDEQTKTPPVPVLSENKGSSEAKEEAASIEEEQNLSPAEIELVEKLKRLQTDKKSQAPLPARPEAKQEKKKNWKESENDILGPAWKRVVKYFYHHIEAEVFQKSPETKKAYMSEAIQLALDATTDKNEHDVVRPRVERELESASPFDRVGLSSDVLGLRVTDKGLLSMDRGHGFGAPEMSFYNGAHVCWSFDRWLQINGVEKKFYASECHGLQVGMWTVNAYFEPLLSSGFLIQFQKTPKTLGVSLEWSSHTSYDFVDVQKDKFNLLVVGKDNTMLMRLFQLIQTDLIEGQMLGVIGERLKFIKDEGRLLFLDQEQSLTQLLKVSETLALKGIVDFELESRGKSVFQQTAFKNLSYWGFVQARHPLDALRRFELQWRLSNPQSDAETIREWIQASFPYVVYVESSGKQESCVISSISLNNGEWQIADEREDEWEA